MKKWGETNNNVFENNSLRNFNTISPRVSILIVFKVKSNNFKTFNQFSSILIEFIYLNSWSNSYLNDLNQFDLILIQIRK